MKKTKAQLRADTVHSESFHIGIELELTAPCNGTGEHNDSDCLDAYAETLSDQSHRDILQDHFGLTSSEARELQNYFNRDSWQEDQIINHSCDDDECPYTDGESGDSVRSDLRERLRYMTGNSSFKVVEDGSIDTSDDTTDAEVCWNYFASKDTIKDNAKILKYLKDYGCDFDESCGLHINVNNYLKVPTLSASIPTSALEFLFKVVAPSREESSYCNLYSISSDHKYSMIYHQTDRLEFRFFSPTLNAEKLNAYVSLAHFVYKRLAGKKVKLPKKLKQYLDAKMETGGHSVEIRESTLKRIENIAPIDAIDSFYNSAEQAS